ncbi:MAG: Maf family protein [Xanthobacteraceae bacterium]
MPFWLAERPLLLASKSEIRRILLANVGIPVEIAPANIDERAIEQTAPSRDPGVVASLLAREKARTIAAARPARLVLGADQTLALGAQRFTKPVDRDTAREQLLTLRGKAHALHSAVALMQEDTVLYEHCAVARLTMRDFSDDFLETYLDIAGTAATASVGGYQLENVGITLFEKVEGDHFTILGLPMFPLLAEFRRMGAMAS